MREKLFPPTLPLLVLLVLEGCATTTANCVIEKDGEIPILGYYYNLPLAAIEIEGKQELMVVDTGSVTSTLTPSAAADLDIKDSAPYPLAMAGVDGAEHDVPSTYRGIQIPGIDIQNTLFLNRQTVSYALRYPVRSRRYNRRQCAVAVRRRS